MGATGMWVRKSDTASTGDPLVLVVVEGADRRTLVLDHFPFTVGRRTDRDLVMADPRVSREHAHFIRETDGTYIIDQGSRHGTFVNGERVNRRKLGRNDRVEFGVQGAAYAIFSPDRSPSSAAQQFLSQFSTWKPATGAGSDLEMLNVFLEAARKLNTSGVLDDVLNALLEAALRLTRAERGFVFLRHADGELRLAAGRDKTGESITDDSTISRSVLRDAAKSASEFLVTDTDDTGKLAGRESVVAHNLHSVICIPLRKTVIQDKAERRHQGRRRQRCAGCPVSGRPFPVGQAVFGEPRHSADHCQRRRHPGGERRAGAGRRCGQTLSPGAGHRGGDPAAPDDRDRSRSPLRQGECGQLCLQRYRGRLFRPGVHRQGLSLIVADVSGKGVSAAVVASILQGMLYSQLARDSSLPEMISAVNRFLCEKVGGQKYATLVVARLLGNGELELINCGHVPPLLVSGDTVTKLEEGNLPVGLVPGAEFQASRLQVEGRRPLVTGYRRSDRSRGRDRRVLRQRAAGKLLPGRPGCGGKAVTEFRADTASDRRFHHHRNDLSRRGWLSP